MGLCSSLDKALREPVVERSTGRHAPRMFKPLPALTAITIGAATLGWFLLAAFARLSGSDVPWLWPMIGDIPKDDLFDIVRSAATVAALVGGLYAILYAYRKQRVEEAAGHRADAEALSRRYQDAAQQLGHPAAAVRLAGAYALARLADEWDEERQSCVDVLSACLRMSPKMTDQRVNDGEHSVYLPEDGDMQVRRTILGLISSRLSSNGHWSACDFDLSGAYLVDFKIRDATTAGRFVIKHATIVGKCEFTRTTLNGGLDAAELRIEGTLKLADALPGPNKSISLAESFISERGTLDLIIGRPPEAGTSWQLWPRDIRCSGTLGVKIAKTPYEQATLHIPGLKLQPTGVFKMMAKPANAKSDSFLPSVKAEKWSTTKSSQILIPNGFRKRKIFKASEWTGVPHRGFEYAYVTPRDVDKLLAVDDKGG